MKLFKDFLNEVLGRRIDVDGAYGPQCVDLFNYWNKKHNNTYINCRPSGFAKSLVYNKNNNGILNYFKETAVNNMIEGTVVVWGNCKVAPDSHVAFFIKDNGNGTFQALHQNVGGRNYVVISNITYDGVIGAFIPKQLIKMPDKEPEPVIKNNIEIDIDALAKRVIAGEFGNGEERKQKLGSNYDVVQARVNQLINESQSTSQFDLLLEVKKTIRGDYGNGEERKQKLGFNYNEVQKQVNLNIQNGLTNWDNIKLF